VLCERCVSSGELISGYDTPGRCPGSQEDVVSNWEPAHSLVEDAEINKEEGTTLEVTGSTD